MLTETPLPSWASGQNVIALGGQTGRPVDDVGVLTDAEGWVCVQAKKKLACSEDKASDLAAALDQHVAIANSGVPDRPPLQDRLRLIDPHVDRVLIVTDETAPNAIRVAMASLVDRLRTWPDGVPLDEAAVNAPERGALKVLRTHLWRSWRNSHGTDLDEATLRELLRPLAIHALDLRSDGSDTRALLPDLRDLLEEPERVSDLWVALGEIGQTLAVERTWFRRSDLVRELETRKFHLTPVARLRRDVQRLREITAGNVASPPTNLAITTPDGPVEIPRTVSSALTASTGNVAVAGDPGVGKSVVLHRFAVTSGADGTDVVYLTADQLRGTAGETRVELNLNHDLSDVLSGWTGSRPALLLLDGVDQSRGVDAAAWLPNFAQRLLGTRWRIIASIRSFDLRHGRRWQAMFPGHPIDAGHADSELSGVAHLVVGNLTSEDIATVRSSGPAMRRILDTPSDRLSELLSNPFNLNLVGELIKAEPDMDFSRVGSRLDLLDRYWRLRVREAPQGRVRQQVLRELVRAMVKARSQHTRDHVLNDSGMLTVLGDLLHDGVLREVSASRWSQDSLIGFAHPVLFDYAASITTLGDTNVAISIADALDADPDLSMVLRPSLDYRLAIAWHGDPTRAEYWLLALRLMADHSGHILAAAAAADIAARELRGGTELEQLSSACIAPVGTAGWTVDDARGLAFLVAAGIGVRGASPIALDAFGDLLLALALHAQEVDDPGLALLTTQLSLRAAGDRPPSPGTHAARCWVQATLVAIRMAMADVNDPRRTHLADIGGPALAMAAVLDLEECADTIRQVISEPVLRGLGVGVIRQLLDKIPDIAVQDGELAFNIGSSVWSFEDDRSQRTYMLASRILPLTSNRQQDLEGAQYRVGQKFAAFAESDIVAATRLLMKIIEERPARYPYDSIPQTDSRPRVRYGEDLRFFGGHHILPKMVENLVDRLDELAGTRNEVTSQAIAVLIDRLAHSGVWNRLLGRAARTESYLSIHLLPALVGPALFAFGATWAAAGHLAVRLSPMLSPAQHQALERAIIEATEPGGDGSESGRDYSRSRRDVLLSAFDSRRIVDDAAKSHLDDLRESGRLVHPLPPVEIDDEEMDFVGESEQDSPTSSPLVSLMREAGEALAQVNSSDGRDAAYPRLLAVWPLLLESHTDGSEAADIGDLLIRIAPQISRLPAVLPDTLIGQQVLAIVQAAMPGPVSTHSGLGINSHRLASWGETPQTNALTAAGILISRPEWRQAHGAQLGEDLLCHLDGGEWIYRYLSIRALPNIYTDTDELLAEAERRLASEPDQHIAATLIEAVVRHLHSRPHDVDQIFARLSALRGSPYLLDPGPETAELHDKLAGFVVQCLTILSVRHSTPFAEATVRVWLSDPIGHPASVKTIAICLRGLLNPSETSLRDVQQKSFELLMLAASALRNASDMKGAASENSAMEAVSVAENISQQVYFASGAFDRGDTDAREYGDLSVFSRLALPLLESLGHIQDPGVTHHIVQTAEHLGSAQPKSALLLAVRSVTADAAYVQEQLGLDAVLDLITRYLADHRSVVLDDPDCITAVRKLLERFVRVGWPRAVQMAERMDELFR